MKQYTTEAYKNVKWRHSGGGRAYNLLHGKKNIVSRLYDATLQAPVYNDRKKERQYLLRYLARHGMTVLDLGGNIGSIRDRKLLSLLKKQKYLRVDIDKGSKPDIVADASKLPLKSGSVDFIICKSLLEHVREPWTVIREAHRVLKQGGVFYFYVPFFKRIHAAPSDYYRYTDEGLKYLLKDFRKVEVLPCGGFFSSLINQLYLVTYVLDALLLMGFAIRLVCRPFAKLITSLDFFDRYKLTPTFYYGIALK